MSTLATDTFTGADAGSLGANWTNKRNSPSIVSHGVGSGTTNDENMAYYNAVVWPADQWAQATVLGASLALDSVGVRLATTLRTGYYGGCDQLNFGDRSHRIWRWDSNGALTSIANEAVNIAANDVIYLEMQGTTLVLKINGSTRLTVTDATYATGNAGLGVGYSSSAVTLLNAWSGGDFASGLTAAQEQGIFDAQRGGEMVGLQWR